MKSENEHLKDVEALSSLLDSKFKGPFGFKFGIDGILGLIPGVGDFVSSLLGSYLLFKAAQLQVPTVVLVKMAVNLMIDQVTGSVPFIGDVFDFFWKANNKNMLLLRTALQDPARAQTKSWLSLVVIALVVGLTLALPIALIYWAVT
jgi:hypothetical protein